MTETDKLILYRDSGEGKLAGRMAWMMRHFQKGDKKEKVRRTFFSCMRDLAGLAGTYGFEGNLWHDYLTLLLVNHENAFSTACEIRGITDGSLLALAKHDFAIFMDLFNYDFSGPGQELQADFLEELLHYQRTDTAGKVYNRRIRDRICALARQLAKDAAGQKKDGCGSNAETSSPDSSAAAPDAQNKALEAFTSHMTGFYREFGVGRLGLHKAFRVEHTADGVQILPVTNIAQVDLDDLVGCELQKKKLIANTEAFVAGRRANNCLLFGDAGTGKSTSIKAILNRYYDRGLRMIEIYKHQFRDLNEVIAQIKNRNYRFILFMDDLSFEEFEVEYKYLKAVIEGGLERTPDNVLIYATSNRRHLIRERVSDNEEDDIRLPARLPASNGGDLHISDTVQEKLSLSSRFGVTIYFGSPDKRQFEEIVLTLAKRNGIDLPKEQLFREANKWELSHGGLSGRTAQQFVDYLLGTAG